MRYDRKKALLYGFLKGIQIEFFGIFVMIFYIAVSKAFGKAANFMFGFTGIMCAVCIMADYCYKQGDTAKNKAKLHGDDISENYGLKIGFVSALPCLITVIILAVSKLGSIGNFLPAFKILNAAYFPIIDLAAHSPKISDMSPAALIITVFFPILYIIPSWIAFKVSFKQIDVKEKVMYKK